MTRVSITSDSSSNGRVINILLQDALEREKRLLEIGLKKTLAQLPLPKKRDIDIKRLKLAEND